MKYDKNEIISKCMALKFYPMHEPADRSPVMSYHPFKRGDSEFLTFYLNPKMTTVEMVFYRNGDNTQFHDHTELESLFESLKKP